MSRAPTFEARPMSLLKRSNCSCSSPSTDVTKMMIRRSKWPFASECDDGTYATSAASPQNTTGSEKPAPSFAEIDAYAPGGINGIDRHIGHIRIGIDPAPQSDPIALDIAPRVRVVVAGMIVMQLGVLVEELPHTTWFREVGAITHQTADGSGLANLIPAESIEV